MKKVIMLFLVFGFTLNLTAQKRINLDTLNTHGLDAYLDKAVKLKNVGMIVTFTGIGIVGAGWLTSAIWMIAYEGDPEYHEGGFVTLYPFLIGVSSGATTAIVGFIVWSTGSYRKSKAEIAIKKFNIVPENSMALGLGITFRF